MSDLEGEDMPQRREGLRPVFRLLGSLAVVLIPFGIYSYLYFDRQYDYHVSRNFRALTEAGIHLSGLLKNFKSFLSLLPDQRKGQTVKSYGNW